MPQFYITDNLQAWCLATSPEIQCHGSDACGGRPHPPGSGAPQCIVIERREAKPEGYPHTHKSRRNEAWSKIAWKKESGDQESYKPCPLCRCKYKHPHEWL